METIPSFPLFPDPLREKVIVASDERCGVCFRLRGYIYQYSHFGPNSNTDKIKICPWCIADGSAAALEVSFVSDIDYPYGGPKISADDQHLVSKRTPGFFTWQSPKWLACCGRPCIYLGEADSSDLQHRWQGAVESLFIDFDYSLEEMYDVLNNISRAGSTLAYIFQCQTCQRFCGFWDCD